MYGYDFIISVPDLMFELPNLNHMYSAVDNPAVNILCGMRLCFDGQGFDLILTRVFEPCSSCYLARTSDFDITIISNQPPPHPTPAP